jgi:hypothetical protein
MKIPQFIFWTIVTALGLGASASLVIAGFGWPYSKIAVLLAVLVALLPTLLAYTLTWLGLDKNTTHFLGFLAAGMLGKMLVGILSILLVAVQFEAVRDEYVVTYIIAYFVFTSFEVYGLIRKLRPKF